MISRLFATYRNFDASRFPLKFATDRFASLAIICSFQTALPYRPAGDGETPQGLAGTGVCRLFQRRPQGYSARGHVRRHRLFYFGEHRHPRAEPDSGNVGLGSAARLVRQPDAWPVHHDHRRGTALRQKAKEAVLHRYLRTLYRFRNDARPVQPADPIRLQLAGRLFSHGIVCAVLCRPAYRTDKAAVPVILRKIFRNLANDLWQLEPEVVFQWGRFYFRGQPLYRGRLSARIHFVISRSGVQVTPPAPIFRFGTQVN